MSLDRKDVRTKLDADIHAILTVLAEVDGCDIGEWAERELIQVIKARVHEANLIHGAVQRLGMSGNIRENEGIHPC